MTTITPAPAPVDLEVICPECGNDTVCEGLPLCTECVEELWPTADAEKARWAAQAAWGATVAPTVAPRPAHP